MVTKGIGIFEIWFKQLIPHQRLNYQEQVNLWKLKLEECKEVAIVSNIA